MLATPNAREPLAAMELGLSAIALLRESLIPHYFAPRSKFRTWLRSRFCYSAFAAL